MRTIALISILLAVLLNGAAVAEEVTWHGAGGDNDWKNPANWDRGRVPGIDDNVTIPSGTPECRVGTDDHVWVNQFVNRGTVSSAGELDVRAHGLIENHGSVTAAATAHLWAEDGEVTNHGRITGNSVRLVGSGVGNADDGVIEASAFGLPEGTICLYGDEVVNYGQVKGGDDLVNGAPIIVSGGTFSNYGTVEAGNATTQSGGWGGYIEIELRGRYLNNGVIKAGDGYGDGNGGKVRVQCQQAANSDTVKAGDSPSGKGGSVEIEAGDFTNSAQISPGGGPLGVGELRIVCPTGEILNHGSIGRKTGKNEYVGNVYIAGHHVELTLDSSDFINADTLVVVGRNIVVSTSGRDARILADNDNRFYVLAGTGVLNLSGVDTMGVNALGANLLFADSIIPPVIGYGLAFSPDPTMSGSDTTWVDASITGLWASDSAGGSDTLRVCITNLGTATRVVNYDVTSARGWLAPLSGATAPLYPLESDWVKTTYAIPDTAATGSRDSMTAVLTINPGFADTSLGEIHCYSGLLGIAEPEGPGLRSQVSSDEIGTTIVRGVLVLGAVDSRQNTAYRADLLDVAGRTVMELGPGANDVRALAPGVYFAHSSVTNHQSSMTKVVIAK